MSEANYILLIWAYGSLHLMSKYELLYRLKYVVPNNVKLE